MTSKQRPILITGVTGQIGMELVTQAPWSTPVVCGLRAKASSFLGRPTVNLDLSDLKGLRRALKELAPSLMIHPAAYTQVDKAEDDRDACRLANAEAMGVIGEISRELGFPVVHFSTDYVYGRMDPERINEDSLCNPLNWYGETKLQGEHLLAHAGGQHLILRTSWVYGLASANFVRTMLRLGREREELKIVADQFGAPSSAKMLARLTWELIQSNFGSDRETPSGVYHLCAAGETHWADFAREIFRQSVELGLLQKAPQVVNIQTADFPTKAARQSNSRLSWAKLKRDFDLEPEPWQVGLESFLRVLAMSRGYN